MLPSKSPIEGDSQVLPENGSSPDNFAMALKGQKKLLDKTKEQAELPVQQEVVESLPETNDLQKSTADQKDLIALFEKYLPEPFADSASADAAAALPTLTDIPTTHTPTIAPEAAAATAPTVDMSGALALTGLVFVKPMPEEAKLSLPVSDAVPGDYLQFATPPRQSNPDGQLGLASLATGELPSEAASVEKQSFLSGLEKALPGITTDMLPAQRPIDAKIDIQAAIARPISHPNWGKDLGEQIVWMNNKDLSAAEIRLNPEHLGPISIRIDVNKDQQASIMFTAQHLEVKEAIEASIPKLREMLVNQQLNLVNVNISQNSTTDQGRPQPNPFRTLSEHHEKGGEEVTGMEMNSLNQVVVGKGLLSLYA
ncbi:flagellar hook-length control protein FliK [Methyloglobulus morosus]|nr:flagellar hook-length control protein FliK [Methyloglobulus morosus]